MNAAVAAALDARLIASRGTFLLDLDIVLAPGRSLAIVGPNGAGKTTAIMCLIGAVPLDAGRIIVGGRVLDDVEGGIRVPIWRRGVGVVFQDYALFPHLSVLDNVAFGPRMAGRSGQRARLEALELLERFGVAGLAHRRPGEISGGQAQRIAIARAIAVRPTVLLLDEPLAALDVSIREEVRSSLAELLPALGLATILVTHDRADATALADDVIVMENGRCAQRGKMTSLTADPANDYVRRFVATEDEPPTVQG